ncbi:hypothetical protein, partial [Bacillus cereus group sp. BfR-BA-01524]|uniref:hypothetical protein n=1 Tax=Bacillus cereus group sp. BfR-BA-01524 TaxID=2920372 RepID=UPI001F57930E
KIDIQYKYVGRGIVKFVNNKILTSTLANVVFLSVIPFSNPLQTWAASSDEIISNHIDGLIEFEGDHEKATEWGRRNLKNGEND